MADLGTLFFGVGLKDMTDEDRDRIRKKFEGMGIKLNVEVNRQALYESVNSALKNKKFTIDTSFNMESAKKAYAQAAAANKTSASDVRAAKIAALQAESEERLSLIRERLRNQTIRNETAEMRLEAARKRAIATQNSQIKAIRETSNQLRSQSALWDQAKSYAGMYFSLYAAQRFARSLVEIRGELDMQLTSLKAILQSEDDAMRIFSQIKGLAVVSPFQVGDLISYTKQLSAFQIPYNELFDTTKRLADLSAGLGVDMSRIILAYGQVRSAAFLRGQEVRQFTEAGIPLVGALADKFSELEDRVVSAGEVFDRISRREVSFDMVKSVIEDLTNEGGKFYGMQEKMAQSVKGLYKNLADNFTLMMNSIGEANDDTLKGVARGLTSVMQNWEAYYKALKAIIAIYGTYKGIIIAVTVAEKAWASVRTVQMVYSLSAAIQNTSKSALFLNSVLKANPLILVASAISAVVGAFIIFNKEAKTTAQIIEESNTAIESFTNTAANVDSKINNLISTYDELKGKTELNKNEQEKLKNTIQALAKEVPHAVTGFDEYGKALDINRGKVDEYNSYLVRIGEESLKARQDEIEKQIEIRTKEFNRLKKLEEERWGIYSKEAYSEKDKGLATKRLNELQSKILEIGDEISSLEKKSNEISVVLSKNFGKAIDPNKLSDWANKVNEAVDKLDIGEKLKNSLKVHDATVGFMDFRDKAISTLKDLKEELKTFEKTSVISPDVIENTKERIAAWKMLVDVLGGVEEKEEKRDKYIDSLKREVELIKSAQSEYEKLRKVMGDEDAMTKLKETSVFSGIDEVYLKEGGVDKLVSDYLAKIGKRSTDAAKDLKKSLEQFGLDNFIKNLEKNLKKADDAMSKYLSENKDKWDEYNNFISKGLSKEISAKLAFGGDVNFDTEIQELTSRLEQEMARVGINVPLGIDEESAKEMFGEVNKDLFKLWQEITKRTKEESKKFKESIADAIKSAMTLQDKLNEAYQRQSEEVSKAESMYGIGSPEALALAEKWNQEIFKIKSSIFELSPEFKKLFIDSTDMGVRKINQLRGEVEKLVGQIEKTKEARIGEDGKIIGYSFVDVKGEPQTIELKSYEDLIRLLDKLKKKSHNLEQSFKNLWDAISGKGDESSRFDFENLMGDIAEVSDAAKGATDYLASMFDAMGEGGLADIASTVSDVLGSVSNIGKGFAQGGVVGGIFAAVGEAANWIGKIFSSRDAKLQKTIERSQEYAKTLQYTYDLIERLLDRFLGEAGAGTSFVSEGLEDDIKNAEKYAQTLERIESLQGKGRLTLYETITLGSLEKQAKELEKYQKRKEAYEKGGAYGYQRQLMTEQLTELEKQLASEEGKKKSSQSSINDYKNQIAELKIEIREFAESVAESLYGIDLKGWASELGDALFDAWKSGEDGAEAFRNKVGDIMGDVMNEVLKVRILEPAMERIQDLLFGKSGTSGIFGEDFTLSEEEMKKLADELIGISDNVEKYYGALDDVFGYLKKNYGIDLQSGASKASNAISGISEDQYNLIISYMNSIRADGSMRRDFMRRIVEELMPQTNLIANAQLQQLSMIQRNTAENARSAEEIRLLLNKVIVGNKIRV